MISTNLQYLSSLDQNPLPCSPIIFLLAFRNIAKQRAYTIVNGLGLAIGLAAALFILLYVCDESTFDTMHPSANETYRMGLRGNFQQWQKTVSTLRASRIKHRWPIP